MPSHLIGDVCVNRGMFVAIAEDEALDPLHTLVDRRGGLPRTAILGRRSRTRRAGGPVPRPGDTGRGGLSLSPPFSDTRQRRPRRRGEFQLEPVVGLGDDLGLADEPSIAGRG